MVKGKYRRTKEHNKHISEALMGHPVSEETKRKFSLASKGRKLTEEHKQKIRLAAKNNPNFGMKNKKMPKESSRKMVATRMKNNSYEHTDEWRKLMSKKLKQKYASGYPHPTLGITPWNKDKKGVMPLPWNKDKTDVYSKETLIKFSARKQNITIEEWKEFIGSKPYTYDFNKIFKEKIRERDNYTCQLCNLFEEDAIKLHGRKLAIHHIDYNKLNTFPQNCITLCLRCNILVNKDREIWKTHFQQLLKKLYNYQYTEDQKILFDFSR